MNIIDALLEAIGRRQCENFHIVLRKPLITAYCMRPDGHPGACRDNAGHYFIFDVHAGSNAQPTEGQK